MWSAASSAEGFGLLVVRSGLAAEVRVAAGADLEGGSRVGDSGFMLPRDTVGAIVPDGIHIKVVSADGRPVRGVVLRVDAAPGSGIVRRPRITTDDAGEAVAPWQLGGSAGLQEAIVRLERRTAGFRIGDMRTGEIAGTDAPLTVRRSAVPGTPRKLSLTSRTLTGDAIGARLRVMASAYDQHGNVVLQPALRLLSSDTSVVRPAPDGSLIATGAGGAQVAITAGAAMDTILVRVVPWPTQIRSVAHTAILTRIGGGTRITSRVSDRLGVEMVGARPVYRILTPNILASAATDSVVAVTEGTGLIESEFVGLMDTIPIVVSPVAASIVFARPTDTLELDSTLVLQFQAFDSSGVPIQNPLVKLISEDPAVVAAIANDRLVARLPGESRISIRSGPAEAQGVVTVEGVALLADGVRAAAPTAVAIARTLELTNGRVRLRWHPGLGERGGFEMDTRIGGSWIPANVRGAGDWLYVTSTVLTEPTSINVVEDSPGQVAVAMRFGNHRFDPVLEKYPSYYQNEPFPFTRTLWLRPREYGYFSWTEIERTMVWTGTELEIGFGGMFGPATIRTGQLSFTTQSLLKHKRFNVTSVPDAAELDLYGDPLMRVLVPLPEAPMISPVFPGWGYGSVYVHRSEYKSYGAYLYAAPRGAAASPRQICLNAWSQAPFPLRALTSAEMAACGAP